MLMKKPDGWKLADKVVDGEAPMQIRFGEQYWYFRSGSSLAESFYEAPVVNWIILNFFFHLAASPTPW